MTTNPSLRRLLAGASCAGLLLGMIHAGIASADHEWQQVPFQAESAHPYPNGNSIERPVVQPLRICVPGAQAYQIHFSAVDLEPYYDYLEIYSLSPRGQATLVQRITGGHHEFTSKVIQGAEALVVIASDESAAGFGFRIDSLMVQRAPKGMPQPGPGSGGGATWPPRPGHGRGHGFDEEDEADEDDYDRPGGTVVPGPGAIPGAQPGYVQVLAHVEMLFGVENDLVELPDRLTMGVGEQFLVVIRGIDQFGQPIPVITSIRSEGFRGNATLRPNSQDTYVLDAGSHVANNACIQIQFPQNRRYNRRIGITVRPRFDFSYRDSGRKINVSIHTGVHRSEVAGFALFYTLDPANLTGGENVTALVRAKTGAHSTLFLEDDHAYPLQKGGPGYFTLVVTKVDGTEVRQTYSIEYKKCNPVPVR